ncbi:MAG: DUF2279 domain-containing protein [Bacteroidetes bacterium 4572_112]|nr:MAG: DUF2279 domain-containing protein [Bacteroidetes bacterium 4572_112]
MNKISHILLGIALLFSIIKSEAQILPPSDQLDTAKLYTVGIIGGSFYVGSVVGLNYAWYKDYDRSAWHSFNDNGEWCQMDKIGHMGTSYYLGKVGYDLLRYSGISHKKSTFYGGSFGFLYLTSIEMLDAYSTNWGFSWGDVMANASGSALFIGQSLIWKEQRISMKYSFHTTPYAQMQPNLLGSSLPEQMLKDYNGQSLWFSANVYSFLPKDTWFPKWLNIAVGYGAEEMVGAFANSNKYSQYSRYRQYYISLDVDWTRIPTRSKFLKSFFNIISFVKFPAPAIEFSNGGTVFHAIYY